MKANELRIGNLVEQHYNRGIGIEPDKIWKLCKIDSIGVLMVHEKPYNYRPIPITEEWLLRFGFYKGKDKYLSPHENSENGHWDRMVYDLHEREFIVNSNEYDGWDVPCEFVHQLQNLYFALTGEELKLNEK